MHQTNVNLWQKRIRSEVIAEHLLALGTKKCVCFSCGNAADSLTAAGLDVVYIGERAALSPQKWFTFSEIAYCFNGLFDATSGHLPIPLINRIAEKMRQEQPVYCGPLAIPSGSGETILCLRLAYPNLLFTAAYDDSNPATQYNLDAPLNQLVDLLCN